MRRNPAASPLCAPAAQTPVSALVGAGTTMRPMQPSDVSRFARVDFRNDRRLFGLKTEDRFSHIYIIGQTGTGKSTLLETMVVDDLERGRGLALIDPHGDLVERVAARVPVSRAADTVYLNVPDPTQPYGYNPLRRVRNDRITLAASGFLEVFKKMWGDAWGVRMEHILRNTLLALLERDGATLADVLRVFSDRSFRREIARSAKNETVRAFFRKEYDQYSSGYRSDGIAPIQNKVGAFLSDPLLSRILSGAEEDLHVRKIMDGGGVLLVNLAKGRLGEDSSSLLGGLLVTTLGLAAYSRADTPPAERRDFFVYVDEFQSFTTLALVNILAELRKYRIGFTIAHQYVSQIDPAIRHAIFGNVGSIISFRVGPEDTPVIAEQFGHRFEPLDLMQLPNHRIYIKLMIHGAPCIPFSAATLPPRDV
jgi:type IV secretory pathway TraG/TraD family ATPase VirD4